MKFLPRLSLRLAGGVLSLLAGWIGFYGCLILLPIITSPTHLPVLAGVMHIARRGILTAGSVAVAANVAFLLTYLLLPRRSFLWRWQVALACGAGAGILIGALLCLIHAHPYHPGVSAFVAVPGASACLFAALSHRWFTPPLTPPAPSL